MIIDCILSFFLLFVLFLSSWQFGHTHTHFVILGYELFEYATCNGCNRAACPQCFVNVSGIQCNLHALLLLCSVCFV